MGADVGEPDCKLINPVEILDTEPLQFKKWLHDYTTQTTTMIQSDSILTIVDPHKIIEDDLNNITWGLDQNYGHKKIDQG